MSTAIAIINALSNDLSSPNPTGIAPLDERIKVKVFGSNEQGIHGAGAAKDALDNHGAIMGQGFGPMGRSFGIPTCSKPVGRPNWEITPEKVQYYTYCFILYAKMHPELDFIVTRVGTGFVGFKDEHMASLFVEAPDNCYFDTVWTPFLPATAKFWGTF